MAGARKLKSAVTLFAAIEAEQHEALQRLADAERRSLADITREALAEYVARHPASRRSRPSRARPADQ